MDENLKHYPEIVGMETELLAATKAMLRLGVTDKTQLYFELAKFYSARCGLEVAPPRNAGEALKSYQGGVESALTDVITFFEEIQYRTAGGQPQNIYLTAGLLSEQAPKAFAAHGVPPSVFDEVCKRILQRRTGLDDPQFAADFASLANLLDEVLKMPDGVFIEGALSQYLANAV